MFGTSIQCTGILIRYNTIVLWYNTIQCLELISCTACKYVVPTLSGLPQSLYQEKRWNHSRDQFFGFLSLSRIGEGQGGSISAASSTFSVKLPWALGFSLKRCRKRKCTVKAGISGVTGYENLFSGNRGKSTSEVQISQSFTSQGLVLSFFQIVQDCGRRDKEADVELIGPLFSSFSSRWVYSIKFKRCSGETSGTGRKFQILNKSYENDYSFDLDLQSRGWGAHRIYCNISCSS